jgi:hypothetical protein
MVRKKRPEYEEKLKLIKKRIMSPTDIGRRLAKPKKRKRR